MPFYEPGLAERSAKQIQAGRLRFDVGRGVAEFGDVHFLCVGTPQKRGSSPRTCASSTPPSGALAPHLRRACVVAGKSTVPVGTAARLAERLAELAPAGAAVELAWNPEFLREGFAIEDTLHPDRLVIGTASARAEHVLRAVYAPLLDAGVPLVVTDYQTAELVKVSANAFLATKISFINAMAEVCEIARADVTQLGQALALDPRIGGRFPSAGSASAAVCPRTSARSWHGEAAQATRPWLPARGRRDQHRRRADGRPGRERCDGSFLGKRVCSAGRSARLRRHRDSPPSTSPPRSPLRGARVTVYDPKANANARKIFPTLDYADSAFEAADRAHWCCT